MTSIFSLRCAQCDGQLLPTWGAIWTCAECEITFEVCGRYLVPVIAERDRTESSRAEFSGTEFPRAEFRQTGHHDPVETDGRANTRDGSGVTGHSASTSPS
jgi:hypothetical protein